MNLGDAAMQLVKPAAMILLAAAALMSASVAPAQTPRRWLAHDTSRPHPPVVAPAKLTLPVAPPADAVVLFDGADLSGWRDAAGGPAKWKVRDGYIESVPNSGYLFTAGTFGDVQLHVEWAAPLPAKGRGQGRGNSGVFLMGLYEVQVLDSFENETYADGQAAAVYGQYPPLANACLPPGEWQAYDIAFRRPRFDAAGAAVRPARLTVWHNGILVQDNVEAWGPTTWLQSMPYTAHADKLPLSLQDHGNPVRFRNLWLRELPEGPGDEPPADERKYVTLSAEQLKSLTGAYRTPLGPFAEIKLEEGQLRLHMEAGQVIDLLPLSETEFALRWTAGKLEFNRKPSGEVGGFILHLAGEKIPVGRPKQ